MTEALKQICSTKEVAKVCKSYSFSLLQADFLNNHLSTLSEEKASCGKKAIL